MKNEWMYVANLGSCILGLNYYLILFFINIKIFTYESYET